MTRIVFMGTPDFSVPVLERIIADGYEVVAVVTQPDRPVGRKRLLTPPPVKIAAEKHGIPVLQPEKIREPQELEKVFSFKPDLLITAAFGQILPKELLDFPKHGCINVHASLLPELRGGAPIHYAIMQGKAKTGVTIMYMVERLDAGDMISKVEVEIDELDHTGSLHEKLSYAGSQLLSETLPKLLAGETKAEPQNDTLATFARNIKREQELIDWSKSGREIYNHIRGLHPWPVAYTTQNGETVKIWWGTPIENTDFDGLSGEVVKVEKDGFIVKTGDSTSIKITDLQLAGKTRVKSEELLRSNHPFQLGTILGN